jgi:DNA-binding response OmpR family regulator
MQKIAVIEDDDFMRKMLGMSLEKEGYSMTLFKDAESLFTGPVDGEYDLIILDINLPGISGGEALKILREKEILIPVIILTGIKDLEYKIETLITGADDYIEKPINHAELLARVQAVLRRSQGIRMIPTGAFLKVNYHLINIETREATSNIGDISLSEKELKLLKFFVQNPRKTLSRAEILENVWGMDTFPTNRTVDNFILKFRKLFEENPEEPMNFITVHSIGYRFEP